MSSTKTETLGLNKWIPTDYVSMSEFNDNFQKLDDAHKGITEQLADIAVNVRLFGAKGDGIEDDTNALQTAINTSPNKKVYLPDGIYKITSTLVLNNTVKIEGQSRDGVVILISSTGNFDAFGLWTCSQISNLTVKIENPTHNGSAFNLFATNNGNKYGKVNNVKVIGTGYTNQTKAIELSYDTSAINNSAYAFYWDFKDFIVDYCQVALYTESDFTKMWATACTFENFIINRTVRGVWFNAEYKQGWYSRFDYLNWQYQCHSQMVNVFDSPSDRSIVDIHVWDRHLYPTTSKAIVIKGLSTNNTFKIRNIGISDVEFEKPASSTQNTFQFSDGNLTKKILSNTTVYVNGSTGSDLTGDGSEASPYKTITNALNILPKELNANLTVSIADAIYNENVVLPTFYGNGLLTIQGGTAVGTKINSINLTRNRVVTTFKNITVQNVSNGIAILQADSELAYFEDVYIVPNGVTPMYGYYIQNSKALIKGTPQINNCTNAIYSSGSNVVVYAVSGSGNTNALNSASGTIIYRTAIPVGFATNNFMNTYGGSINHRLSGFGLVAISSGTTSVVVTHNLGEIPNFFNVTPQGNVGYVWVSSPTTTQFTINCSNAPASAVQIGWEAKRI